MAHKGILRTPVKPFRGHSGSRINGKKKNWVRKNEKRAPLALRMRCVVRQMLGRPAHA